MKLLKPIISPKIYFPGLITLVLLPLVCIYYSFANGWFIQKGFLRVVYYNDAINQQMSKLTGKPQFYPNSFRKFKEYTLTGDEKQNDFILKRLIEQNNELTANKDTVNGYSIKFTNRTKYADVVKTVDMFEQDSINYLLYKDNVYIFWVKPWAPPKGIHAIDNRALLYDDVIIEKPQPTFSEKVNAEIDKLKAFWPCLIPLFGMFFFWSRRTRWHDEMPKQVRHDIR